MIECETRWPWRWKRRKGSRASSGRPDFEGPLRGPLQPSQSASVGHARCPAIRDRRIPFREMIAPVPSPRRLLPALLFSFWIQFQSALRAQVFFLALGYELPFAVNLFVAPVIYFVSHLPISFGGFGVREAAFILLYGLFGVPPEIVR
ncbi:lysylphosphatidylglycerol synthase transmembrane domain-containing protein [Chloroflexota bacterium]